MHSNGELVYINKYGSVFYMFSNVHNEYRYTVYTVADGLSYYNSYKTKREAFKALRYDIG